MLTFSVHKLSVATGKDECRNYLERVLEEQLYSVQLRVEENQGIF